MLASSNNVIMNTVTGLLATGSATCMYVCIRRNFCHEKFYLSCVTDCIEYMGTFIALVKAKNS